MKNRGFTLMELMVVIVIILVVAGIALPAMSGFMKQRRLKGAVNIIQSACLETRARAIAQKETQYLLCYAQGGNYQPDWPVGPVVGEKGTLFSYDSSNISRAALPPAERIQLVSMERLPDFTRFAKPATNFALVFYSDGTAACLGFADDTCDLETVTDMGRVDIVIEQDGLTAKGLLDVASNTGRVLGVVREP